MLIDRANLETTFKGFKAVYDAAFKAAPSEIDKIAMRVGSETSEEEYGWLGQFPSLREWIGDRIVHELTSDGFKIKNRKFESTVKVKRDDLSDDRFGIYKPLFDEMGRVTKQHPDRLAFELLTQGFATPCFDRQFFFDADHPQESETTGATVTASNVQAGGGEPWFLLDLSRGIKPVIFQEREKYRFQKVDADTDHNVFMRDEYLYGIRARVNVGFGLWQLAFASKADLTAANLRAAFTAMTNFRGDRGQLLGIRPTHLVVGNGNYFVARDILESEQIDGTSNTNRRLVDLIATPFLA